MKLHVMRDQLTKIYCPKYTDQINPTHFIQNASVLDHSTSSNVQGHSTIRISEVTMAEETFKFPGSLLRNTAFSSFSNSNTVPMVKLFI